MKIYKLKSVYLFLFMLSFLSCSNEEDKAIISVLEEVERGAVLRTKEYRSNDFLIDDPSSLFSVFVEEDDIEEGDLLQEVDVYLRYIGKTPETQAQSGSEILYQTFQVEEFEPGPFGRPSINIDITFSEALEIAGLTAQDVAVKDQFVVRLDLKLTDGRTFNTASSSSIIIAYDTFFSSPFCYTINVVQPIDEAAFTGVYRIESILDSPT